VYLGRYLGDPDSLVWAGGAPVADVPPPPAQDFPFACLYSDGSREFVSDPSSCPSKPGLDLIEVDDLTQVSPGPPQIPSGEPPAIVVNVPIDGAPIDIPPLPLPPPIIPVQFPPAPPATSAPQPSTFPWWLLGVAGLLLFGSQRRRRVSG
jgi:MYXO-CTERM domain-containing protein